MKENCFICRYFLNGETLFCGYPEYPRKLYGTRVSCKHFHHYLDIYNPNKEFLGRISKNDIEQKAKEKRKQLEAKKYNYMQGFFKDG